MKYNKLGNSGLKVSKLSFGSWLTFGAKLDIKKANECIRCAYDNGINSFDNAEVYGDGISESIMGQAIKEFRRESIVVSTKIFWSGQGPNDIGLSRKHLFEATHNSLKRLDLKYVDLLYCHRPDPDTPIVETVRAMSDLITQGYAFYWGTSEWSACQIEEAYRWAEKLNCIPPTMEQPEYNLFKKKRVENEYMPLYEKFKLGTTTWSPLAFGILSGKYNNEIPKESRLSLHPEWRKDDLFKKIEVVKLLEPIAQELNCTLSQFSIAWCMKNPNVSSVILGSSNVEQLNENIKSLDVVDKLTDEVMLKVNSILDSTWHE